MALLAALPLPAVLAPAPPDAAAAAGPACVKEEAPAMLPLPCASLFGLDAFPHLDAFIDNADFDALVRMDASDGLLDDWVPCGAEGAAASGAEPECDGSDGEADGASGDEGDEPCGKRPRHRGGRTRGAQLTLEAVRAVQHLALRAAAARCNMGTTQFKLQCRKLGIARWPHRKLKSLSGLISSCKAASTRIRSEKLKDALTEWTAQLEAVKTDCLARPTATANMPTFVDRIRQWDVKHKYYARKGAGWHEINSCPPPPLSGAQPAAPPPPSGSARRRAAASAAAGL